MPKIADRLSAERLRELARVGAEQAVRQLRAEIIAIERTFPELKLPQARRALRKSVNEATRRTRRMSEAARKAVSARMKRYWAERRKARAKVR
jgi:2-succinyl-5-enolpyruvyl-6-hydroxy-3-cyclohexene-1-carboxylate synthase